MQLKIGEVARRTGLSVRTLRHYDDLGLLRPGERSGAAYRLYSPADLKRLLHIQSLKSLGLSLAEVQRALDDPAGGALSALEQHMALIERRIEQERQLLSRLRALQGALQGMEEVSWTEVAAAIELSERVEKRVKQFLHAARDVAGRISLNDEQRAYVGRRAPELSSEAWTQLLTDIFTALEAHTSPGAPEALALAARWQALLQGATGGRPDIASALGSAYQQHLPPEFHTLWAFISDAMQHLSTGAPMTIPTPDSPLAALTHPDKNVRIRAALDLGAARQQEALPSLIERLAGEEDFFVREQLTWAVVRMGEAALPALLQLLEHPDAPVRAQAVHTLSKLADPRAIHALERSLTDADPQVARKAVFALGQIGSAQALSVLVGALGHADAERRNTLSAAVQAFGSAALAPVILALDAPTPGVRAHAADILCLLGDPQAVPALAALLSDPHWDVRFAALSALGHLPGPAADALIKRMTEDDDARLRAVASRLAADREPARHAPARVRR